MTIQEIDYGAQKKEQDKEIISEKAVELGDLLKLASWITIGFVFPTIDYFFIGSITSFEWRVVTLLLFILMETFEARKKW